MSAVATVEKPRPQLVRYEAMRSAIAVCHSVDEIKDLHDKALALELYTRQARDLDAEKQASDIRLRAERRAGELLSELTRATPRERASLGGAAKAASSNDATKQKNTGCQRGANTAPHGNPIRPKPQSDAVGKSQYATTLERSGISKQTAGRWQELAKIPEPEFEAALADPTAKPSTSRLIQKIRDPIPQLDDSARVLWGLCWAFERDKHASINLEAGVASMLPTMRADAVRLVPQILRFFNKFSEVLNHEHA